MSQSWDNVASMHDHLLTVHAHKHRDIVYAQTSILPGKDCPRQSTCYGSLSVMVVNELVSVQGRQYSVHVIVSTLYHSCSPFSLATLPLS